MTQSHQGRLYSLPLSRENAIHAAPGQFVFPGNDSDYIAGFISEVDHENQLLKICIFDPLPLPEGAVLIQENMSMDDMQPLLAHALEQNPDMCALWARLIQGEEVGFEG
ncbi:hypothetical protein RsoM2USA_113 [Ralstonia phage RsoM2USA]|nr:hypothetical protein RsoM2USA_113 [Ralstonia phage RsoM2USA]